MSSISTSRQTSPLLKSHLNKPENRYVDLSIEMKNRNRCRTVESDDMNQTYFVYQCGNVRGPYTVFEIIGKCARNEIHLKSEKILFCPTSFTNEYHQSKHHKIWSTLNELKQCGYHEQLCSNLEPFEQTNIIIQRPPAPDAKIIKKSFGVSMHNTIHMISLLLSKLIFIWIAAHFIIPLIICTIIYILLYILCCTKQKRDLFSPYSLFMFIGHTLILKNKHRLYSVKDVVSTDALNISKQFACETRYVATFIGFTATPSLIVTLLLTYYPTHDISEDNVLITWVTFYIIWCVFVIIDYFCVNLHLWYKHVTKFVIGIHVTNIHKQDLLLVLCALSATLPATIGGYITYVLLEEKMTLRCNSHTVSNICIDGHCCYIVSNHDLHIANIIAIFAGVRLLSWAVHKADTTLYKVTTGPF